MSSVVVGTLAIIGALTILFFIIGIALVACADRLERWLERHPYLWR